MHEPIQVLMEKVRCPGWPACVEEIYEKAMARYDAEGCFLADPACKQIRCWPQRAVACPAVSSMISRALCKWGG